MSVFEGKNKRYRKQLIKLGGTKFYEWASGRHVCSEFCKFYISRVVSRSLW